MATLSQGTLFKPELVSDLISKVSGRSSLAKLSKQVPVPFTGTEQFTFSMDSDIDIVAENGKKTHGGGSLAPIVMIPIKVEYGMRVSDEFMYASEERKVEILKTFNEGFAKRVARGLDLMAFHGINPRSKQASSVIGDNHFNAKATQTVTTTADPDTDVETAVGMIQGSEGVITGIAIGTSFSTKLASVRDGDNGPKKYPELAWGGNPNSINGVPSDVNVTVESGTQDLAIVGDFANMFQWGYAKDIILEVIPYGDPDNSGNDLKGYNQVYLRAEAFIAWAIFDGNSFARIVKG